MNYERHLKDLRNKLEREHMSLLIGAGFSKNVHPSFLSWDELLYDLTKELFCDEISTAFQQQSRSAPKRKLPLSSFTKQKCREITARLGYLEIVTEYIRRKGYPEAIATYIEERTPTIEKVGSDFKLKVGGTSIKINSDRLNLHRKVIELPWSNIYTTNYDELLDCCIDETQVSQLRNDIEELENETSDLYKVRIKLNSDIESIMQEIDTVEVAGPVGPADLAHIDSSRDKEETSDLRTDIEKKIKLNEEKIRDNDLRIKEKEIALLSRYHIVRNAADLRLKRTKNIIKLHGSLRSAAQRDDSYFEFDGDPHKQYVIAKEDYDNYPAKHEAFTQLMRISLLQESFCLIGFSGVDPNFKAWINWVKDILHKEAIKNKHHQYKIYLIDVGDSEIPIDQQLFYENHSIVRIPLRSASVMRFLESETHSRVKISDTRTALQAFLTFLENGESINREISQLDLSVGNARNKIWKEFQIYNTHNGPDVKRMHATLENLSLTKGKIWIGHIDYVNTHNQHSLISYVNYQGYKKYLLQEDSDNTLKKLVLLALKELYLPISNFLEEDVIAAMMNAEETNAETKVLLSRIRSFQAKETPEQSYYDRLLFLAYSFKFKELKESLLDWNSNGHEVIQQSGLMSIFNSRETADRLTLLIEDEYILTDEELLYGYELLHFLKTTYTWPTDRRIKRAVRNYEKAGFQTLESKFKYLTEQLEVKFQKPVPFGANRYSRSTSISFRNHTEAEAALQYLMLLAESGFQLMIDTTYRHSVESWYNLFKSAFEYYPYPFLFYSLQYSDDKFLRRLGQEYAFSEGNNHTVRNELVSITERLLDNFFDAPVNYQHSILVFLSKLIIAVDPYVWQDGFLRIWRNLTAQSVTFEDPRRYNFLHFFISGIQFISDPYIMTFVVKDTLTYIRNKRSDNAISYLYYLNSNVYFKRVKTTDIKQDLRNSIDETIEALKQNREDLIFVVGNLHVLLDDEQKTTITKKLRSFDYTKVTNPRSWRVFLYFIRDDFALKQVISNSLIKSKGVWHTGINGNSYSYGGVNLVELSKLTASKNFLEGISWKQEELENLYQRLTVKIPDIQRLMSRMDDEKFDFLDVLDEMYWFLQKFEKELSDIPSFHTIYNTVSALLKEARNYAKLEEGLVSDDHSTVVWALAELSTLVYQKAATEEQIHTVLYKVLLQNNPALEAAVSYIAAWSDDILEKDVPNIYASLYKGILKRFKDHPLTDVDVAFIDEKLMVIADNLHATNYRDEVVSWWRNKAKSSIYNNIKQYLIRLANQEN